MSYQPTPGAPVVGYAGAPPMQPGMYPNPSMGQPPMVVQPGAMPPPQMGAAGGRPPVQWMQLSSPVPNCPPGLEYLAMVDQVLVHQLVEVFEVLTGWETANKYAVKNSLGQQCYFAVEGISLYILFRYLFLLLNKYVASLLIRDHVVFYLYHCLSMDFLFI